MAADRVSQAPRLLIVDDSPEFLELLAAWFSSSSYDVTMAHGGLEAIDLVRLRPFDVIVTDLKMPGLSGMHLLSIAKQVDPAVEVIVLSGQGTMEDAIEALREGRAFDFLQKPIRSLGQLNTAIERALQRRAQRTAGRPPLQRPAPIEPLTPREEEILRLLNMGCENREIAERLTVTEKTVKNHLTRIYEKLKVKNRVQAVLLSQQYGLV